MGTIDDRLKQLRELEDAARARQEAERLHGGGGGGTSDGMEPRIARLESDMEHVKKSLDKLDAKAGALQKDVSDVRVAIATVAGDVKHLPGKGFVVTATTSSLGLLTAIILFGDRIKALLGL